MYNAESSLIGKYNILACVCVCIRLCLSHCFPCICACVTSCAGCVHVIPSVHVWTAFRLLCASAIRFQSLPSIWLSCCGGCAPWGNVIIPCWPQSTASLPYLSQERQRLEAPSLLQYQTAEMSLKPCYISEFCIKPLFQSPPLISF